MLEVDAAEQAPHQGHHDVLDEGVDDLAEGAADDDADRQVDDVALHGKFLELADDAHCRLLVTVGNG